MHAVHLYAFTHNISMSTCYTWNKRGRDTLMFSLHFIEILVDVKRCRLVADGTRKDLDLSIVSSDGFRSQALLIHLLGSNVSS